MNKKRTEEHVAKSPFGVSCEPGCCWGQSMVTFFCFAWVLSYWYSGRIFKVVTSLSLLVVDSGKGVLELCLTMVPGYVNQKAPKKKTKKKQDQITLQKITIKAIRKMYPHQSIVKLVLFKCIDYVLIISNIILLCPKLHQLLRKPFSSIIKLGQIKWGYPYW